MKNLKISFVIPAYNEEKYIKGCLESIFQELENKPYDVEIIVVNNASTDKTKEIVNAYSKIILVDEPQKGLVRARDAGFLSSTGDLIANIDADTRLTPNWIEKVIREFQENNKLVALSGPYIYCDLPKIAALVRVFYYLGYGLHFLNHRVLKKGAMLQGGNFILRRTALEKIGGYNQEFDFWGEDSDIARRIQKLGEVKFMFNLPMRTSARRFKKEGVLKTGLRYALNHLWTIFFKKSFNKKYQDIR